MLHKCKRGHQWNDDIANQCPACLYGEPGQGDHEARHEAREKEKTRPLKRRLYQKKLIVLSAEVNEKVRKYLEFLTGKMKTRRRPPRVLDDSRNLIGELRETHKLSFPQIAKLFGYKDHSTVLYHYQQWKKNNERGGQKNH